MKSKPFNLLIALFIAASIAYKLTNHFEQKVRFALLPIVRDYSLAWLMDVMILLEAAFVAMLLLRGSRKPLLYGLAIYFSIHIGTLAYQKLYTSCSECIYHSNFIGEPINISILLFLMAMTSVLLASAKKNA